MNSEVPYSARRDAPFPVPAVDVIIEIDSEIVLIERKYPPRGWALPGGFVEKGESLEEAAIREAREETGLEIRSLRQFHTYSDPGRDPRFHTVSTVFTARGEGELRALSDAAGISLFDPGKLPENMVFDHAAIIEDYMRRSSIKE